MAAPGPGSVDLFASLCGSEKSSGSTFHCAQKPPLSGTSVTSESCCSTTLTKHVDQYTCYFSDSYLPSSARSSPQDDWVEETQSKEIKVFLKATMQVGIESQVHGDILMCSVVKGVIEAQKASLCSDDENNRSDAKKTDSETTFANDYQKEILNAATTYLQEWKEQIRHNATSSRTSIATYVAQKRKEKAQKRKIHDDPLTPSKHRKVPPSTQDLPATQVLEPTQVLDPPQEVDPELKQLISDLEKVEMVQYCKLLIKTVWTIKCVVEGSAWNPVVTIVPVEWNNEETYVDALLMQGRRRFISQRNSKTAKSDLLGRLLLSGLKGTVRRLLNPETHPGVNYEEETPPDKH